jgi:hypothetical protein
MCVFLWPTAGQATEPITHVVIVMLLGANVISDFITRKVLALSFLMMVGVLPMADALGRQISKGYVYFAMAYAFSRRVDQHPTTGEGQATGGHAFLKPPAEPTRSWMNLHVSFDLLTCTERVERPPAWISTAVGGAHRR